MAIIGGTSGNDTRIGTKYYDTISTGNGNDLIFALQGNDTAYGGNGQDTAYGGDGRDWLYGAAGRDSLYGDAAGDRLEGGNDNDYLNGGGGADTIWGGNGADQAWGADGNDSLYGGNGDDLLAGGAGNDSFRGASGTDTAVFAGSFDGYAIVRAGGLITVTDTDTTDGNDGADRLIDVEKLQFADRTVTLRPLDLDALVGNYGQENQLLVNQGGLQGGSEGDFLLGATVPGGSQDTLDVALGDLDGDGAVEVTASGLPWLGSKLPTVADVDWAA